MANVNGSRSILAELGCDEIPPRELAAVMSQAFGTSSLPIGGSTVLYGADDDTGVSCTYKNGEIVDIRIGSSVQNATVDRLREKIQNDLIDSLGFKIRNRIFFSFGHRIKGHWNYSDRVQILPAPKEAPTADYEWAEHPFLVKIRYQSSANSVIDNIRFSNASRELELLLNALLGLPIASSNATSESHWVWPPKPREDPAGTQSVYLQRGYTFPEFSSVPDEFEDTPDVDPIPLTDPQMYYSRLDLAIGEEIDLPSDLTEALDLFSELDARRREQFLRAAYWYQLSYQVFQTSQSTAFIALINAVEALIVQKRGGASCPECHKQIEGPTLRFRDFLGHYAPMPGVDADEIRRDLYKLRSAIDHGNLIFDTDTGSFSWGDAPVSVDQNAKLRLAQGIVHIAMNNWLRAGSARG